MLRSWTGLALSAAYLAVATYLAQDELRHSHGGWINLRGMGFRLITAPSQVTLGVLLRWCRVPPVDFADPGVGGYLQVLLHILLGTAVIYGVGIGAEWLIRGIVLPLVP